MAPIRRPVRRKDRKGELELEILRGALAGSGDLAYSWDLESDSIDWLGRVDEIFGISAAAGITYGGEFHRRINPDDLLIRRENLFNQQQEVSQLTFLLAVNVAELLSATGKFFELLDWPTTPPPAGG